jgi:hypothetical protein
VRHYPPAYYAMKRQAQQMLAKHWNPAAILLMGELHAWWHCADKEHEPARSIWRNCRRYARHLRNAS